MGWKKALFFGGAVLVLAACSDSATAPSNLRPADAQPANLTFSMPAPMSTPTAPTLGTPTLPKPLIDPLCSGFVIRTGADSSSTGSSCTSW